MPKPNLFVIGAMKSGTSSLHYYLAAHPQIFMSDPKEPSYFAVSSRSKSASPQIATQSYCRSEEEYLRLFENAQGATIIGESSTNYTKLNSFTQVPQRIAAFQPDARFIYIMRDPLERTISQLDFGDFVASFDSEDDQVDAGNPDLEPEKAWQWKVTYERRLAEDAGVLEAQVYYNDIEDHIDKIAATDVISAASL